MDPIPFLLTVEFDGGTDLLKQAARLQILARKHGIRPTWLVGAEALAHPAALEPLARWQREGESEVGALVDAARVPPLVDLGGAVTGRQPVLTDYPDTVLEEKLAWFSATLGQAVDRTPTTIRCVHPAVDERYFAQLAKQGFKTDLSVVPHAKYPMADFSAYPEKAYLTPQGILEIPRTTRRRKYGPLVEDLLVLPGLPGAFARRLFPTLRCLRLRRGNGSVVRHLLQEAWKTPPDHLDLRISHRDWARGDALLRDLERVLQAAQPRLLSLTTEEFLQRYKTEQLRKGLV